MHNESNFTTIDEHNCAIETSSLDEKVKNKFHTKLKSKTNKSKSKIKKQIDRKKSLNIKTRHINEYKDKIKDFPIHECVLCERLLFKSQTFHLTKKKLNN
jgi:hypothetical protein